MSCPAEILMSIFTFIDDAPSQICLALTNKMFAGAAQVTNLARFGNFGTSKVVLLDRLGRDWMPETLRYCPSCNKFRPKTRAYWAVCVLMIHFPFRCEDIPSSTSSDSDCSDADCSTSLGQDSWQSYSMGETNEEVSAVHRESPAAVGL